MVDSIAQRFALRGAAFLFGALVAASAVDAVAAQCFDTAGGKNILGGEVREVVRASNAPDPRVEVAYFGDSVARQLFRHGEEKSPDVMHLTANISVSFAG